VVDLDAPVFTPLRAVFAADIRVCITWPVLTVSDTAVIERKTDA